MSSRLPGVLDAITALWVALVPPDRTTVGYHEVDGRRRQQGTAGDRSIEWMLPERAEPVSEAGIDATQVEWAARAVVRLSQAGRSRRELVDAAANEAALLTRAVEKRASWPAGTIAVLTRGVTIERDEDEDGDALLELALSITVEEVA